MRRAKDLLPVETGRLKDSGRVETTKTASGTFTDIVFGGPEAPYATQVHERVDIRHETGQAKYLETAVRETSRGMTRRMADRLSQVLRKVIK